MIENTINYRQVYSLVKKLQESRLSCRDNKRELEVVKSKDNSKKVFLKESGLGINCSEGFFVEEEYWNILKQEYIKAGYKIKKEKINKKDLIGSIFWGTIALSVAMPFLYFTGAEIKTDALKKKVYELADTNFSGDFEYEELYNLGRGLEIIAKDEKFSMREIKERIDNLQGLGKGLKKFEKYLMNNK